MHTKAGGLICGMALATALSLCPTDEVSAQEPESDPIHWAYAAFYGVGRYSVDATRTGYAFGFSPRRTIRDAALTEDGERQLGLTMRYAFSIGAYDFETEDLSNNLRLDNVSSLSFVPGIEIDVPMSDRWRLKPVAHLGFGKQMHGGASAWIYAAGIKSELQFPQTRVDLRLVNALTYIGYSSSETHTSKSGNTLPLMTGLEFRRQLDNTRIGGEPVNILWHVAYTSYLNELGFDDTIDLGETTVIDSLWELGVGFSRGDDPLRLWKFSLDRVNLVLTAESDGSFSGVSFVFSSLFER